MQIRGPSRVRHIYEIERVRHPYRCRPGQINREQFGALRRCGFFDRADISKPDHLAVRRRQRRRGPDRYSPSDLCLLRPTCRAFISKKTGQVFSRVNAGIDVTCRIYVDASDLSRVSLPGPPDVQGYAHALKQFALRAGLIAQPGAERL